MQNVHPRKTILNHFSQLNDISYKYNLYDKSALIYNVYEKNVVDYMPPKAVTAGGRGGGGHFS